MFPANRPKCFYGTPGKPGTGWFDREGVERPVAGHYGSDAKKGSQGKPFARVLLPCSRCGGAGGSDKWLHTGWTCFDCNGNQTKGEAAVRLYTAEELAVLNERRDAIRAKKLVKRQAEQAAYEAAQEEKRRERASLLASMPFYQDFKALMATFSEERPALDFLQDMFKQIETKDLSEKQVAAVQKFIDSAKKREEQKKTSHFIGSVGERIEIVAKVVMCKEFYATRNNYSFGTPEVSYLIKFETLDNQVLTWFTSRRYENGVTVQGRATIKGHREFNGIKETQITNFRVKGEVDGKQKELF